MKKVLLVLIAVLLFTACSNDDNEQETITQSHIVEFTTGILDTWVSVYATTILTFEDGTELTINTDFDSTENKLSVEIPENTASFILDFYIEDSSEVQMRFYGVVDNVSLYEEIINQQSFEYQYSF